MCACTSHGLTIFRIYQYDGRSQLIQWRFDRNRRDIYDIPWNVYLVTITFIIFVYLFIIIIIIIITTKKSESRSVIVLDPPSANLTSACEALSLMHETFTACLAERVYHGI